MATGFAMEGIEYTVDGLSTLPAHAALIGEIVATFSLIEGTVGGIYGMLRHESIESALEELKDLSNNSRRVAKVRKLISDHALLAADPRNDELMKSILDYAERRNKIVHGLWGSRPGDSETAYSLPLKKWIPFNATLVSSGTDGTTFQRIEELRRAVDTYNLATLSSLKMTGNTLLLRALELFNSLAKTNARMDRWGISPPRFG